MVHIYCMKHTDPLASRNITRKTMATPYVIIHFNYNHKQRRTRSRLVSIFFSWALLSSVQWVVKTRANPT